MAETLVADYDDTQAQADLNAGFGLESPPETAGTKTDAKVEKVEPPKVEPKPVAAAPKYVQLTQEQFDSLQSAATKTTAIEAQLSKVFGTVGDMQQIVKKLQAGTPVGQTIEIPKDAFAELEQDFPELATKLRNGLEKTIKSVRGTGTGTEEAPGAALKELAQKAYLAGEVEALEDAHPTWREIVGAVDGYDKHDPKNPFRAWLAKQDTAYQHRVNNTNSARVIARAIDRFQAATKPVPKAQIPAPKVAARTDRIRAAIQPRGDGGQPNPSKHADDDFHEGFRTG